jgi:hypothetical protein
MAKKINWKGNKGEFNKEPRKGGRQEMKNCGGGVEPQRHEDTKDAIGIGEEFGRSRSFAPPEGWKSNLPFGGSDLK